MTKDEALKLALEALKGVLDDSPKVMEASISGGLYEVVQCKDAITAIKEALAQPAQEPVAHLWECLGRWSAYLAANGEKAEIAPPSWLVDAIKNATTPPAAKPAQQPQVRTGNCLLCGVCASEGHKIQAKRPWAGLTDIEIMKIINSNISTGLWYMAIEIQAKLKEKNS